MVLTFRIELKDFHDSSIFKNVFFNVRKLIGFKNSQKKTVDLKPKSIFTQLTFQRSLIPSPHRAQDHGFYH